MPSVAIVAVEQLQLFLWHLAKCPLFIYVSRKPEEQADLAGSRRSGLEDTTQVALTLNWADCFEKIFVYNTLIRSSVWPLLDYSSNYTFLLLFSTVLLLSFVKQDLLLKHRVQTKSRSGSGAWNSQGSRPHHSHARLKVIHTNRDLAQAPEWQNHCWCSVLLHPWRAASVNSHLLSTLPLWNVHSPENVALASPTARSEKGSLSRTQPVNIVHMLKAFTGDTLSQVTHLLL